MTLGRRVHGSDARRCPARYSRVMPELHEALAGHVAAWRETGYAHDEFAAIGEILGYATEGDGGSSHLRFLRAAQFRALETYWRPWRLMATTWTDRLSSDA